MRVALVTVGDELLAGDTVNTNATWLASELTNCGATLERVTTVPDRFEAITDVLDRYRRAYDAVVVTGGLGPTPDDLTMEAVARTVGVELTPNREAREWLERNGYSDEDLAPGTTQLPEGCEFLPNHAGVAPGCRIENVYVLPGVPHEMKAMFEEVCEEFTGESWHVERIEADEAEKKLLERIERVSEEFGVTVGSYPGETVTLKLEGHDSEQVQNAAEWLRAQVDQPPEE